METTASPSSSRAHRSVGPRLYGLLAGAVALAGLAGWFALYPLDRWMAGILVGGYGLLVAARPSLWLVLMPALWPVVDLAPWSGQIHVTESDALALATLAALGLREAVAPPPATLRGRAPVKLTLSALALFGLLAASVLISGLRGLGPQPVFDAAALVGYNTPVNALRVGKGFVLAFALIPFLHLAIRRDGEAALDRIVTGLTLGLATCGLAALWERLAFPGLTNFAADYRSSALFWEMHVGGAALDAWLALSLPFALAAIARARHPVVRALALGVLLLGFYAAFTTFSRIVYGALLVAAAILGGLALLRPAAGPAAARPRPGTLLLLTGALVAGCALGFSEGGYRALLAFAGLAVLGYAAGGALPGGSPARVAGGVLGGLMLTGLSAVAMLALPKGVYLAYGVAWLITAATLAALRHSALPRPGLTLALLTWLAGTTVLISAFWSTTHSFAGTALGAIMALALLARQALGATPLWAPRLQQAPGVAIAIAMAGMVVTTLGSYYMGDRLSATGSDIETRSRHFRLSLGLVPAGVDSLLGLGLGRYPAAYFWEPGAPRPSGLALGHDATGAFMQIGPPAGVTEPLRLSQRIPIDTAGVARYSLKARSEKDANVSVSICRKHLLYVDRCASQTLPIAGGKGWQNVAGQLADVPGPLWPPRLAVFSVEVSGPAPVDLSSFALVDAGWQALLANGDLARGSDFWFFTSDHEHLPWHAKNLFVHTYVEQGLLGVAALTLILAAGAVRLFRQALGGQTLAGPTLAALAGVLTVGMVDSVVDMPRVTVFLMFLLWLALTLRQPPGQRPAR